MPKKKLLAKTFLLSLIACTSVAHAIDVTVPTSVHDILSPEQINELKTSQKLKDIKLEIRANTMEEAIVKLAIPDQSVVDTLFPNLSNYINIAEQQPLEDMVAVKVGGKISFSRNVRGGQQGKFRDPNDPDGLVVKMAPSDDELF